MSYEGLDDYLDTMSSIAEGESMAQKEHRYWVTTVEDNYGEFGDDKEFADLENAIRHAIACSNDWGWVIRVVDTADNSFETLLLAYHGVGYNPIAKGD